MADTMQGQEVKFDIPDPEPGIYPLRAVLRGPEVFVTICALSPELANSYQAKQAAYEVRKDERVSMRECGIETQGAAYPAPKGSHKPIHTKDAKQAKNVELRYCRMFRLTPAL